VFVLANASGGESLTSARGGQISVIGDDRFLVLEKGQRTQVDAKTGEHTLASFQRYQVLADDHSVRRAAARAPRTMSTLDLLLDPVPKHQAELAWRFGLLFGAANLLLLGVGLSATNPRRATNWNLLFALLGFVVYYNLINLSQAWVAGSRIALAPALLSIHGGAFVLGLMLIWWRDHGTVWRPWARTATP
jgi:lipopolysaccharide export system permease protein